LGLYRLAARFMAADRRAAACAWIRLPPQLFALPAPPPPLTPPPRTDVSMAPSLGGWFADRLLGLIVQIICGLLGLAIANFLLFPAAPGGAYRWLANAPSSLWAFAMILARDCQSNLASLLAVCSKWATSAARTLSCFYTWDQSRGFAAPMAPPPW